MRDIGKALLVTGAIGAGFLGGAIAQAADFEQQIANVRAVSQASEDDMHRLRDAALDMGAKSSFSASQAAEAQLFLAQSGQKTQEIIESLPGVMALAASQQVDLGFATQATTAALSQFNLAAADAERVANVFAAAASNSKATVDALAFALRQAGPVANALGFSLEATTAAVNLLLNAGFRGEQAGTILRGALSSLLNPSKEAAEVMAKLGLNIQDADGKTRPFVDIIDQLQRSGIQAADAMKIFGQEAGPGMLALIAQGSQALADMELMITGTNEAARQAEARLQTLQGQLKLLFSALERIFIDIGSTFIPPLKLLVQALTALADIFNSFPGPLKAFIAVLAAATTGLTLFAGAGFFVLSMLPSMEAGLVLLTTKILPVLVTKLAAVKTALLAFATNPITLTVAAVGALVAIWLSWNDEMTKSEEKIQKFNEQTADTRGQIEKTKEELKAVQDQIKKVKAEQDDLDLNKDKIDAAREALKAEKEELKKLQEQLKNARTNLSELRAAQDSNAEAAKLAADAQEEMKGKMDAANESIGAQTEGLDEMSKALDKAHTTLGVINVQKEAESLRKAFETLETSGTLSSEQIGQAYEALQEKLERLDPIVDARRILGVQDIDRERARLLKAYDTIARHAETSAEEQKIAFKALQDRLKSLKPDIETIGEAFVKTTQKEIQALQAKRNVVAESLSMEKAAVSEIQKLQDDALQQRQKLVEELKKGRDELKDTVESFSEFQFQLGIKGFDDARIQREELDRVRKDLKPVQLFQRDATEEQQRQALEDRIEKLREVLKRTQEIALAADKNSSAESTAVFLANKAQKELIDRQKERNTLIETQAENLKKTHEQLGLVKTAAEQSLEPLDKLDQKLKELKAIVDTTQMDEAAKEAQKLRAKFEQTFNKPITQVVRIQTQRAGELVSTETAGDGGDLPSAAAGRFFVHRDGPIFLHKGEQVLSRPDADRNRSGGSGEGGLRIDQININVPPGTQMDRRWVRDVLMQEIKRVQDRRGEG
nr:phage tail tape measure protein [Nitrospina gracilis]